MGEADSSAVTANCQQHISCKAAYNPLIAPKVQLSTMKDTQKGVVQDEGMRNGRTVLKLSGQRMCCAFCQGMTMGINSFTMRSIERAREREREDKRGREIERGEEKEIERES